MGLKLVVSKMPDSGCSVHIMNYENLKEAQKDADQESEGTEKVLAFLDYESSFKNTSAFDILVANSYHYLGLGDSFGEELENLLNQILNIGIEIGQGNLIAEIPDSIEKFGEFIQIFEPRLERIYPGKISFIPPEEYMENYMEMENGEKREIAQAAIWLPSSDFGRDPDAFCIFLFNRTAYFTEGLTGLTSEPNERITWKQAVCELLQFAKNQAEECHKKHINIKQLESAINYLLLNK